MPLDAHARAAGTWVAATVGEALAQPFCRRRRRRALPLVRYRVVCGPYEEIRTQRKPREPLAPLEKLREQT